jgi:tRNA(fMet)-specific endonuclease VapC
VKYLFDTDVVSALIRREPRPGLHQRLARVPLRDQGTTTITLGELSYGAHKAGRLDLYARARLILSQVEILAFDERAAEQYGPLRHRLERRGARLDEADLRIGSIALANERTLVTGNARHFERIEGLTVENWLKP